MIFYHVCDCIVSIVGFPPEFRVTVYVRNFFPFPLLRRFRNSGILDQFRNDYFICKQEISGTLFRNSGKFRNIVPENSSLRKNCSEISRKMFQKNVRNIINVKDKTSK